MSELQFGRWQTIGPRIGERVECRCTCGTVKRVIWRNLTHGLSKSCGCGRFGSTPPNKTHGMTKTLYYKIWTRAKGRCLNKNNPDYPTYGARGITMDPRWAANFAAFMEDMGMPPTQKHTLGRINNDGPYTRDNCRWETTKQQANNRRSSVNIEYEGEVHTAQEWAELTGIKPATIYWRFHRGWPAQRIFSHRMYSRASLHA